MASGDAARTLESIAAGGTEVMNRVRDRTITLRIIRFPSTVSRVRVLHLFTTFELERLFDRPETDHNRSSPGRPEITEEIVNPVIPYKQENPRWGYQKIPIVKGKRVAENNEPNENVADTIFLRNEVGVKVFRHSLVGSGQ